MTNLLSSLIGIFAASVMTVLLLAFIQNVSFSIVSRSRNRDNISYHLIAASFSNMIWFLTFRQLVLADMDYWLMIPYGVGSVSGSIYGVKISMWIERKLGATSDGHLIKKPENLLVKFLTEKKCLKKFNKNFKSIGLHVAGRSLDDLFERNKERSIFVAFRWKATYEKYEYWSQLNEEFLEYYKQHIYRAIP